MERTNFKLRTANAYWRAARPGQASPEGKFTPSQMDGDVRVVGSAGSARAPPGATVGLGGTSPRVGTAGGAGAAAPCVRCVRKSDGRGGAGRRAKSPAPPPVAQSLVTYLGLEPWNPTRDAAPASDPRARERREPSSPGETAPRPVSAVRAEWQRVAASATAGLIKALIIYFPRPAVPLRGSTPAAWPARLCPARRARLTFGMLLWC